MADNLDEYFSSMFTKEYISALPVQRQSSKGESVRLFRATNCNPKNGS